jgi:ribosomal protein S8E
MIFFNDDNDSKRTLGIRDKQILYRNAKGRCENPACGKKIEYDEMQVGHKTAWSKGGRTTLKKSVCLCYRCNKLQGTDSWATFMKKQNVVDPKTKLKKSLQVLSIKQLKHLADKHNIIVKGQVVESLFDSYKKPPTKSQYINKLSGVVTEKEIQSVPKETIKNVVKRKKKKSSGGFWL